jgi:acetylornithine/succinyldiaminopimelate/putrescine aminotransferase
MSVTGQEKIHSGFGDLMQPITFVPANDISSLEEAFDDTVCGFILEPIQGEGGVIPLTSEYIEKARELCDTYNAVLVFDEIQTGIGRTGTYFAFQQYTVQPDVVTMAKGLGGGFPMGAMLVADNFTDVLKSGMHGSTFGGNHLACAVAYEVLRTMEAEKILANVIEASDYLNSLLENLKTGYPNIVKEIRGMGLLIGIVLREDIQARPLVQKALEKNLIIGRAGDNVIRLAPPLIVRMSTIERAVAKLEDLIRELE